MPLSHQRDGSLLAMTASVSAALEELTSLAGHSISLTPHRTINFSNDTGYVTEFLRYTHELVPHGVVAVHYLKDRKMGVLVESPQLLLTFESTLLLSSVHDGYVGVGVRLSIPTPRRCFNCQCLVSA